MDNYVIGEEENYSDFIKELILAEESNSIGEEIFIEEKNHNPKIEDYWFLAK
jgi:hypothetical protein